MLKKEIINACIRLGVEVYTLPFPQLLIGEKGIDEETELTFFFLCFLLGASGTSGVEYRKFREMGQESPHVSVAGRRFTTAMGSLGCTDIHLLLPSFTQEVCMLNFL